MRGADEGGRLHHRLSGRGPDHLPSEVDVRCREAAALPCLPAGRLDGGRGAGGIFLRTRGFQGLRRSIVFRRVFRSSATKMSPANPAHANFLVLDFDPRSGLSFFREGRQRFRAEGEGKYFAAKKESLIPRVCVFGRLERSRAGAFFYTSLFFEGLAPNLY